MTITQALPLSARIAKSAPRSSSRDTGIDFVRALCVAGVVLLHALMVGVTVTDAGPLFENASETGTWITPLSWILQVMPLFFVIGGFSGLLAYRRLTTRGGTATDFVAGRIHRLLLPALVTIAVVGVALALLAVVGVPPELIAVAGYRFSQPLWFLGVFLLCQALLPVLLRAHERVPLRTIGALFVTAAIVDALRITTGIDALGFLNLAFVWLTLQQLGFFLADGRIDVLSRRVRALVAVGALMTLVASFVSGIHSPDLIANINPPTVALVLVGVVHTFAFSLFRDRIERFSRGSRAAAFTGFVTRRAMTVYLWHMPVLLAMAGASAVFSFTTGMALPALNSVEWWLSRPLWLATAFAVSALVAMAFTRIESRRTPTPTGSRRRITVATLAGLIGVVLLLAFGTTVLTAAIAIVLLFTALRLAGVSGVRRPAFQTAPQTPPRSQIEESAVAFTAR